MDLIAVDPVALADARAAVAGVRAGVLAATARLPSATDLEWTSLAAGRYDARVEELRAGIHDAIAALDATADALATVSVGAVPMAMPGPMGMPGPMAGASGSAADPLASGSHEFLQPYVWEYRG
jgi:hypothetical protein